MLVAQLGGVVPSERGIRPGGQLRVAAARQAVQILHQPRDADHEPVEIGAVTAHQGVGALYEGRGHANAELVRALAREQSVVRIGPRDQRGDRLQLRRLGVAEIAAAAHADRAVRAGQGGGPPYGVVTVALLVRLGLSLPFGGEPAAVSWRITMNPRLAAARGSRPTASWASACRTAAPATVLHRLVDIRAHHGAVTHLRRNIELNPELRQLPVHARLFLRVCLGVGSCQPASWLSLRICLSKMPAGARRRSVVARPAVGPAV